MALWKRSDPDDGLTRRRRFEALFGDESRAILGYALRRVSTADDAADIVAETFMVAWRRIDDVPDGADARPWLYGVARRVLANHVRGQRRRDRLAERLRDDLLTTAGADRPDEPDAADTIREAMARLSDDDRELLRLTGWEGLGPAELATAMGLPGATVRTRLHRARGRLRRELELLGWFGEHLAGSGHVMGDGYSPVRLREGT